MTYYAMKSKIHLRLKHMATFCLIACPQLKNGQAKDLILIPLMKPSSLGSLANYATCFGLAIARRFEHIRADFSCLSF